MQLSMNPRAGLGQLLAILSFAAPLVDAHSWVESVYKIDPATRKFFGAPGYPRGGDFRRLSQGNVLTDEQYIHRLPPNGVWSGDENINKRPISESAPPEEILEVSPGDFIAIQHLENGHVSEVGEGRALNGGTLFIYGTSEPKDEEKIFDIHLKWNEDGTGGDKRGRLLATRNFDDKQCYEGNGRPVALERSKALGTEAMKTLPCQSDIQLPDDLAPGSTYTMYWYWDWPTFNVAVMDMEATRDGSFPWSGAFKRGDKDTLGYGADIIATPESYASTIDVKVVEKSAYSVKSIPEGSPIAGQDATYSEAIKKQLDDGNFAVKVPSYEDGGNDGGSDGESPSPSPSLPVANPELPEPLPSSMVPEKPEAPVAPAPTTVVKDGPIPDPVTVTVTKTVTDEAAAEPTTCEPTSTQTVTELETQLTTIWADAPSSTGVSTTVVSTPVPSTMVTSTRTSGDSASDSARSSSGYAPTPTPQNAKRNAPSDWTFPQLVPARAFVARPRRFVA